MAPWRSRGRETSDEARARAHEARAQDRRRDLAGDDEWLVDDEAFAEFDEAMAARPASRADVADDAAAFEDDTDEALAGDRAARPGDARRPLRRSGGPRRKVSVLAALRDIPNYLRLSWGLLRDVRVSKADKLLVAAAVLYVLNPFDFIPDVIPFLGEIDDLFLIVLAVQRMISRAGRAVVRDHWRGRAEAIDDLNLAATLSAAAFFLPGGMRRRLMGVLRGRGGR